MCAAPPVQPHPVQRRPHPHPPHEPSRSARRPCARTEGGPPGAAEGAGYAPRMRIALVGTRGPGHYGGFETCVAELAPRLAERGHDVVVYARRWQKDRRWHHDQVRVVTLPSIPTKNLDTISHTAICTAHLLRSRPDAAIVFGVGNAPFARFARRCGVPIVLNVDGLDRARAKWGRAARWYLHRSEVWSPKACDVLVTDARSIQAYYREVHDAASAFIPYGAPAGPVAGRDELDRRGLTPGGYVLYVSRLEPENNAHVVIEAHRRSGAPHPLVVVGGSAYGGDYEERLHAEAGPLVTFTGFVFGDGYAQLQSHAMLYVQATEVGGTHPALVEAMGYGNAVIALDTPEHREVLADAGLYYRDTAQLAELMRDLAADPEARGRLAAAAQRRVREHFSWDAVTRQYEEACLVAITGSRHGSAGGDLVERSEDLGDHP